jgi:hypothetical protein
MPVVQGFVNLRAPPAAASTGETRGADRRRTRAGRRIAAERSGAQAPHSRREPAKMRVGILERGIGVARLAAPYARPRLKPQRALWPPERACVRSKPGSGSDRAAIAGGQSGQSSRTAVVSRSVAMTSRRSRIRRATGTLRREASPRRLRTTHSSISTETVRGAVSGLD